MSWKVVRGTLALSIPLVSIGALASIGPLASIGHAAPIEQAATQAGTGQLAKGAVPGEVVVGAAVPVPPAHHKQSVLLVVLDDVGLDYLSVYGLTSATTPPTPTLDFLAAIGMRFDHAYANPVCSATRSLIHTGRLAYKTGIGGTFLGSTTTHMPRSNALPKLLKQPSAIFGKWHAGNFVTKNAPPPSAYGYDEYYATEANLAGESYFSFTKSENGAIVNETTYATTDTVDDAIAWIVRQTLYQRPWFANVSFHSAHVPHHVPPTSLQGTAGPGETDDRLLYMAMIEAMDTELGRLLSAVDLRTTTVIVAGDNGTGPHIQSPYSPGKEKGTVYEGGVRVPLIIAGQQVLEKGTVNDELWSMVDLYPTIQELCNGYVTFDMDGISIVPTLRGAPGAPVRQYVIAERFTPVGQLDPSLWNKYDRMVRDDRYKLIHRELLGIEEFYDLLVDPYETTNLLPGGLSGPQQADYLELTALLASFP